MSALTIIALEAVLRLLRAGHVDQAEEYAQSALDALRLEPKEPDPEPDPPVVPSSNGQANAIPDWDRARALARKRAKEYRANRKAARAASLTITSASVTRHVTGPATERDASRDDRDGERDGSRDVSSLSRSPSFSSSLFLSESLKMEEGRAREGTSPKSSRDERDASRDGEPGASVTRHVTKRDTASIPIRRAEKPPPSETSSDDVTAWCAARGLDAAHPSMVRFLDIRRNAKPVSDWLACWRVFLSDEASGRFEPRTSVKLKVDGPTIAPALSPEKRLKQVTQEEALKDTRDAERFRGSGPPPEPLGLTMKRLRREAT